MTPENFNIDELRKAWKAMGDSLGMSTPDDNPKELDKKKTALDRLRNSYGRFQIVAAFFAVSSFLIFSRKWLIDSNYGLYIGLALAGYFLIMFVIEGWFWRGIGTIDPLTMSAAQVSRKALFYRKRHLQMIAIMLPVAIAVLCFTGYAFSSDKYFLTGMITGAIFGFTIGCIQLMKFMDNYRKLAE